MRQLSPVLVLAIATALLAGCRSSQPANMSADHGAATGSSSVSSPAQPPADPATLGSVAGIVRFAGKPPARVRIDMSADPACAMAAGDNMTEQYVVANDKLANVFVYVKSGASSTAVAAGPPVILDQKGCRYVPHVIGVQEGGSVEFRNSDPTVHNVHMVSSVGGNNSVDISQGPNGAPQTRRFPSAELMLPVRCNNHPWMSAFINVAPSPYFAVSAADGTFRITGLPPGTYTVAAVHEKLGEKDAQITIAPHTAAQANFSFGPM